MATESEDSEDEDDFIPTIPVHRATNDDEAGSSGTAARAPPPPITAAQVTQPDRLADILEKLTQQQMSYTEEQRLQRETQRFMFQEMRQHQEAVRQQMLQQSQMQQQMFTYLSGCIGTLYRHSGLPEPELPTTQQLQYDPSAPPPPIGGYVQTPLASFPMSPLL